MEKGTKCEAKKHKTILKGILTYFCCVGTLSKSIPLQENSKNKDYI